MICGSAIWPGLPGVVRLARAAGGGDGENRASKAGSAARSLPDPCHTPEPGTWPGSDRRAQRRTAPGAGRRGQALCEGAASGTRLHEQPHSGVRDGIPALPRPRSLLGTPLPCRSCQSYVRSPAGSWTRVGLVFKSPPCPHRVPTLSVLFCRGIIDTEKYGRCNLHRGMTATVQLADTRPHSTASSVGESTGQPLP